MKGSLLLRNARIATGAQTDVLVEDGKIAEFGVGLKAAPGIPVEEATNQLLLPAFVDPHMHIDKTLIGMPWMPHWAGPDRESRIRREMENRNRLTLSVEERAGNLVRQIATSGTAHIRTHVDIHTEVGLRNLEGVLAVREELGHLVSIEVVAFPQNGVLRDPGTLELMAAAIDAGADVVGGMDPWGIDDDIDGQLDAIFGLAEVKGRGLDIHLHDPAPAGLEEIDGIVQRTRAHGMQGQVTISHAFCLGEAAHGEFDARAAAMANAEIANITNASGERNIPPARKMFGAGVLQACASDDIRDTWSPFGNGDMLERAMLVAWRNGFRRDEDLALAFDMATAHGARLLKIEDYGLAAGCKGDFCLVDAETLGEAVVARPARTLVVKDGNIIARDGALVA